MRKGADKSPEHINEFARTSLKAARLDAGLSQAQLAEKVGMAQSLISAYERGQNSPGILVFARIMNACGYEVLVRKRETSGDV